MFEELVKASIIVYILSIFVRLLASGRIRGIASFRVYVVYSIIYVGSLLILVLTFIVLAAVNNRIYFYSIISLLALSFYVFLYFFTQISVKIFKKLQLPWTVLFIVSPILAVIFSSFSNSERMDSLINDYDESIDYKKYIKILKKAVPCTFVNWFYTSLIIDDFTFTLVNDNNNFQTRCLRKNFEKKFEKAPYFLSHFSEIEVLNRSEENYISFYITRKDFFRMLKDFSAIVVKGDKLIYNNIPLFVRNEDYSFGVIYNRRQKIPLDFIKHKTITRLDYNYIVINKFNLMILLENAIFK